jgi:hypothetical protein
VAEDERILAEIARRRQRAKELGLFSLLNLFCDHLVFLKDGPNPASLPKSVTDVKVVDVRIDRDLILSREIFFGEKAYLFVFKPKDDTDPPGAPYITGHLLLIRDGQTVFDLYCLGKDGGWIGRNWEPFRVGAFIEGIWVQEIVTFAHETFDLSARREQRSQSERRKNDLEELKKKFGLP